MRSLFVFALQLLAVCTVLFASCTKSPTGPRPTAEKSKVPCPMGSCTLK